MQGFQSPDDLLTRKVQSGPFHEFIRRGVEFQIQIRFVIMMADLMLSSCKDSSGISQCREILTLRNPAPAHAGGMEGVEFVSQI